MDNSGLRLTVRGAFSYNWNKGIDNNDYFFVNIIKSIKASVVAHFCHYTVHEHDMEANYLDNHKHS